MTLAAINLGLTAYERGMISAMVLKASGMSPRDEPVQLFIVHPLLKEVVPSPPVRSLFSVTSPCHACSAPIHRPFIFMTPP
ncbi:hypothetical protein [Nioella sp.]|uniref:hypothetical protein n=1 Tax=Nioella sp. TaxID=1912091 RepID=UPI003A888C87